MMMETRDFSQKEWHDIISQFNDINLIQLFEYGEAKAALYGWRAVRHIWHEGERIVGAAQVMIKTLPLLHRGLVWINRAPLYQKKNSEHDQFLFLEMLKALRSYWGKERKMYLRIAPTLEYEKERVILMRNVGFHEIKNSQWASAVVDLTKPVHDLRSGLDKK